MENFTALNTYPFKQPFNVQYKVLCFISEAKKLGWKPSAVSLSSQRGISLTALWAALSKMTLSIRHTGHLQPEGTGTLELGWSPLSSHTWELWRTRQLDKRVIHPSWTPWQRSFRKYYLMWQSMQIKSKIREGDSLPFSSVKTCVIPWTYMKRLGVLVISALGRQKRLDLWSSLG